jgi:hypothetical protein
VEESRCPFCAASLPHAPARPILRGRVNRAAVFAAALVTPACSGAKPDVDRTREPPPQISDAQMTPPPPPPDAMPQTAMIEDAQQTDAPPIETQQQTPAPAQTATLHGRISNARTGEALGGWGLTIHGTGMQPIHIQANDRGRYTVKLPPGVYTIQLDSNHPRRSGPMRTVTLKDRSNMRVDLAMTFPDPSSVPMPYGAPPARARTV